MKTQVLIVLSLILLVTSGAFAQDKKTKKKKSKQPALAVVTIEDAPLVVDAPVVQKPANGSLFTDGAANGSLLVDFKAGRVGDLVFVDVVETSTATVVSGAKRDRDSGTLGGLSTAAAALPISGAAAVSSVMTALGQRKFEGNGQTERKSNVKARITARVVEVLPNGDLRIQALKLVRINKETEQMAVTGIVRRNDLAADNSIPTIAIGDLRVDFNGKGVASADNAPGWLFRLFDKVSPF
jgi:flagellar L-ring protein precursor FlgH